MPDRNGVRAEAADRPPRQVLTGAVAPSWSHRARCPAQFGGGRSQAGRITSGPAWLRTEAEGRIGPCSGPTGLSARGRAVSPKVERCRRPGNRRESGDLR